MKQFLLAVAGIISISAGLLGSIYESLNISEDDAKKCLVASIGEGYVSTPDHTGLIGDAKQLSSELKVQGIRELIQLAKEYTATDAFKKDYAKWRKAKLNPDSKTKLGLPKLGKMLDNAVDNKVDKKQNQKNYPEDGMELVKKRLTDFLEISSRVDFDAEVEGGRFVKPEYENKNGTWKMIFRAGKDVIEAAREDAQKWLNELNAK
jgi:hypothetical protein